MTDGPQQLVEHSLRELQTQIEALIPLVENSSAVIPHFAALLDAAAEVGALPLAIFGYRHLARIAPQLVEVHNNLGGLLLRNGNPVEAEEVFRMAVGLRPDLAETHNNLGSALQAQKQFAAARECFSAAIQRREEFATAHYNLGVCQQEIGELETAALCYQKAIQLRPDYLQAHNNLGVVSQIHGEYETAAKHYHRALELDPTNAECRHHFAHLILLLGDFSRGFREYESRWDIPAAVRRNFSAPLWIGEPLKGLPILLHAEQGLGDTFQFVRYVEMVRNFGGDVILEVQRPLVRFLSQCGPKVRVVAQGETLPPFATHAPLLSLPRIFGTTLKNVPASRSYLHAAPELVDHWRSRLGALSGLKVGLNWQGNPQNRLDRFRSPPLSSLLPFANIPGVAWLNLQKGIGHDQLSVWPAQGSMIDFTTEMDEASGPFMDTAALMKNLDLVITSDTAIAHLAGALGVPTWLMLPFSPDWRWQLQRTDSPWYPTMRLFRQPTFGDWTSVARDVADALRKTLTESTGKTDF